MGGVVVHVRVITSSSTVVKELPRQNVFILVYLIVVSFSCMCTKMFLNNAYNITPTTHVAIVQQDWRIKI